VGLPRDRTAEFSATTGSGPGERLTVPCRRCGSIVAASSPWRAFSCWFDARRVTLSRDVVTGEPRGGAWSGAARGECTAQPPAPQLSCPGALAARGLGLCGGASRAGSELAVDRADARDFGLGPAALEREGETPTTDLAACSTGPDRSMTASSRPGSHHVGCCRRLRTSDMTLVECRLCICGEGWPQVR
jgi:hypothetical protein